MERRKLSDRIVEDVLAKIGSGELDEGAALPSETAFSASYGVSRSVAREALRGLAAKGFIDAKQGSTTVVAPRYRWHVLDPDFLAVNSGEGFYGQLQEARELLEPLMARMAASRATPDLLEQMNDHIVKMDEVVDDAERHAEYDIAFHEAIATATGNPVLVSMHNSITNMARRTRVASVAVPGATERAAEWHRHVYQAISTGDPEAAEAAMRMHLVQVKSELERLHPE